MISLTLRNLYSIEGWLVYSEMYDWYLKLPWSKAENICFHTIQLVTNVALPYTSDQYQEQEVILYRSEIVSRSRDGIFLVSTTDEQTKLGSIYPIKHDNDDNRMPGWCEAGD